MASDDSHSKKDCNDDCQLLPVGALMNEESKIDWRNVINLLHFVRFGHALPI